MAAPPWRDPKEHELKCWPPFYRKVVSGEKTFEVRLDDRGFMAGDSLRLREWDNIFGKYTGRWCRADVPYLLAGTWPGLQAGYVVMSIKLLDCHDEAQDAAPLHDRAT